MRSRYSSHGNLPPKPIILLSHKLFVVEYTNDMLYATDGLIDGGISLLCLIVNHGQFILKIINNKTEDYYQTKMALYQV